MTAILGFGLFIFVASFNAHAETLIIYDSSAHKKAVVNVELAETPMEREKGLMYRQQLAPDSGMLFLFHQPVAVKMWMKNTYIPLDMLFADINGQIFHIEENARPLDLTARGPDKGKSAYVLEVPAGMVKKNDIFIGDMLAIPEKSR